MIVIFIYRSVNAVLIGMLVVDIVSVKLEGLSSPSDVVSVSFSSSL
jgi:hypothetical protein